MMGATLSIMDVDVFNMVFTKTIFSTANAGSSLMVKKTKIRDVSSEGQWTAISVDDSADAKLDQVEFFKNRQFKVRISGDNQC